MDRVRSLSIVLQDIDVILSQLQSDSQEKEDLEDITASCRNLLGELEKTLDKYGELESKQKSAGKTGEEGVEEIKVGARGYPRTSKSNQLECCFAEYL